MVLLSHGTTNHITKTRTYTHTYHKDASVEGTWSIVRRVYVYMCAPLLQGRAAVEEKATSAESSFEATKKFLNRAMFSARKLHTSCRVSCFSKGSKIRHALLACSLAPHERSPFGINYLVHAGHAEGVVLSPGGDDEVVVVDVMLRALEHLAAPQGFRLKVYPFCCQAPGEGRKREGGKGKVEHWRPRET